MLFSRHSFARLFSAGVLILLLASFLPLQPARAAGVRYAAPTAQGSGDCSSWANACTLQTALTNAVSGDEIWVKAGVHYPGTAGNRAATFTLKNGVAVYGGFAGTETSRSQRDWVVNKTILSGDIDKNDAHGGDYINESASQIVGSNAYHVVTGSLTDSTAVLDGFVITAGQANGSVYDSIGGGMSLQFSGPTLTNLTFSGNLASTSGGGIYNAYGQPVLNNVTFSGNQANAEGGGMENYQSDLTLTQVTFSDNVAVTSGGGMFNQSGNLTLTNVTFSNNTAGNDGGGMFNQSGNLTLTNVTFSGNSANSGSGGGIYNIGGSSTLINVTFSANNADALGGGMYNNNSNPQLTNITFFSNYVVSGVGGGMANEGNSNPTLTNVVFRNNYALAYGGGLYNDSSSPTLVNVTFNGNLAYNDSGGGIYNSDSSPTLTNVILWGDSAPSGAEIYNAGSSAPLVSYSDIQGGYAGTGNINANPLFGNAAAGVLRLQLASPAIDAGNNAAVPSGIITDLDGNPRFVDITAVTDTGSGTPPIVDMGAYEAFPVLYADLTTQGNGKCYAWEHACTLQTALGRAVAGQEIWVKAGVYYPGAAGNRAATFQLKSGVAVYGGFVGTETARDQRNWATNLTILSGDIDQNDSNTDGNFIAETPADVQGSNAYHVVTGSGTDSTAVLDGFVITAGRANGSNFPDNHGGGMYNYGGNPALANITLRGNSAMYGGGIYNKSSSPILTDVIISDNSASSSSGY